MSVNCLLSDLAIAYATGTSEAPALQYCDYSAWSATRDDSASRAYWTEQLASLPDDPDIPLDFPRPMTHSLAGAKHRFSAGRDLTDRLISLARSFNRWLRHVVEQVQFTGGTDHRNAGRWPDPKRAKRHNRHVCQHVAAARQGHA